MGYVFVKNGFSGFCQDPLLPFNYIIILHVPQHLKINIQTIKYFSMLKKKKEKKELSRQERHAGT